MRTRTALGAVAVAMTALPAPALAENGYEAQFVSRTPDRVVESGEAARSSFTATNTGTGAWDPAFTRLGTSNPRDRASSFFNAADWYQNNRPTPVDQASVAPGQNGSFTFVIRAPEVSVQTPFDEYFAPVADGYGWMDSSAGWPAGGIPIRYTVVPRSPPTARITSSPERVGQGEAIQVEVEATDNVRISHVTFSIDGKALAGDSTAPYAAALPSSSLAIGRHSIEARAYDGAGQQGTATASVDVLDVSPGAPNGTPAVRVAHFTGGFGKRGRSRITVGYGKGARLRGRLVTSDGVPIAGAALEVASRVLAGNRGFRRIAGAHPVTGVDGQFTYRVPKGASRQVRIGYRAYSRDLTFAAQRVFSMRTRAGVRLRVTPRRVGVGGRIRLSGNLRGGPKPRAGVLVVLQALEGGRWRSFRTIRTKRKGGRFSTHYRFTSGRTGTFRLRALVRKQIGYAYSTGSSRTAAVSVR